MVGSASYTDPELMELVGWEYPTNNIKSTKNGGILPLYG
jgi:hypothetical protein